ncbi:MAG TPA: DNA photolyase [Thermoanaerobaculia bacterium]|nr:DNA photolyase [Thermoanaerobaculia bacterium]
MVPCARYGEIFNRRAQSFRLQKRRPSLILARKHRNFVHEAPKGFGIAGAKSFCFSHMLNCIYDCRYCFLQGMYRSAHYVIFVNYEDFQWEIEETIRGAAGGPLWFFSGYDCDSLALEPVTRFAASFVPFFARFPQASLELRTKSTQIKSLLEMDAVPNVVVAWSLTPEEVQVSCVHLTPSADRRLRAMERLEERGWKLGLRFDPLIYNEDYRDQYRRLFRQVFSALRPESLHSVSLGPFRLTQDFFKTLVRLYPEDPFFAAPFEEEAQVSYRRDLEAGMVEFCTEELLRHIPRELFEPGFSVAPGQPVSGPVSPNPSL